MISSEAPPPNVDIATRSDNPGPPPEPVQPPEMSSTPGTDPTGDLPEPTLEADVQPPSRLPWITTGNPDLGASFDHLGDIAIVDSSPRTD